MIRLAALRWRLARRIAPWPVLRDPFPEHEGAFIVMRSDGVLASVQADTFRLKMSSSLAPLDYDSYDPVYRPHKRQGRFVGTVSG